MNCHETQLTSDLVPAWTIVEVLAPHLFWGLVILLVIMFIGLGRIREAVLNARKIGFGGFEIELKGAIAEAAQAVASTCRNMCVINLSIVLSGFGRYYSQGAYCG